MPFVFGHASFFPPGMWMQWFEVLQLFCVRRRKLDVKKSGKEERRAEVLHYLPLDLLLHGKNKSHLLKPLEKKLNQGWFHGCEICVVLQSLTLRRAHPLFTVLLSPS